jgi:hypothetical protein
LAKGAVWERKVKRKYITVDQWVGLGWGLETTKLSSVAYWDFTWLVFRTPFFSSSLRFLLPGSFFLLSTNLGIFSSFNVLINVSNAPHSLMIMEICMYAFVFPYPHLSH